MSVILNQVPLSSCYNVKKTFPDNTLKKEVFIYKAQSLSYQFLKWTPGYREGELHVVELFGKTTAGCVVQW